MLTPVWTLYFKVCVQFSISNLNNSQFYKLKCYKKYWAVENFKVVVQLICNPKRNIISMINSCGKCKEYNYSKSYSWKLKIDFVKIRRAVNFTGFFFFCNFLLGSTSPPKFLLRKLKYNLSIVPTRYSKRFGSKQM